MMIRDTNFQTPTEHGMNYIPCYRLPFLSLFHADCMDIMKQYPDKYFDLAIVDPPYDFSISKTNFVAKGKHNEKRFQRHGGSKDKGGLVISSKHESPFMKCPTKEYFDELFRISKHQIIWGGNYFTQYLPPSMAWIYWGKENGDSYFSDGELAWTSFGCGLREVRKHSMQPHRIHPTQKPEYLYTWILNKYLPNAFSGRKPIFNKIIDTHLGSGSIALAVDKANRLDKMNLHLTACEIDKEYIDKAIKRISESIKQGTLSF